MRESLLKAAEQRMDAKLGELQGDGNAGRRLRSVSASRPIASASRTIVAMYENMKSKDAARIFDRLDLKILVEVSTQMKPAKMAEILGQMTPEAAERLTVELANRASGAQGRTRPAAEDRGPAGRAVIAREAEFALARLRLR